jgi:formylglycine-generating enzyme required for sulfatase activity
LRYWLAGILALLIATFAAPSPARAGIDETYRKPDDEKSWGELLADFVGYRGFSKSYALVIGISQFDDYTSLPTANDPIRMRDFLIDEAGFDHVHILTDDKATKARIDELMVDVLPNMIDENDQFLFYWSGHGEQRTNARGGDVGYLPVAKSSANRYSTMVSMGDIRRWDDLLRAKQALFLLDACFSGLAGVVSQSTSTHRDLQISQLANEAHQLVTAGTGDQKTIAADRWGGSIFTDAVLRAIRGEADAETSYGRDGVVSFSELISYVKTRVAIEARNAGWDKPITPQPRDLRASTGEFFFVTNERKVAKLESAGAQYQVQFEHGVPVVVMGAGQARVAALPSVSKPPPQQRPAPTELDPRAAEAALNLRPNEREAVQRALTELGFDTRGIDGKFGENTRRAIAEWQRSRGGEPTRFLTAAQYASLLAEAERKVAVGVYDEDPPYEPGDEFRDCDDCPLMVVVPAGSFTMGSTEAERKWAVEQGAKQEWVDQEKPQHRVTIEQPFAVGKYEVTRDQFAAFVQATGHDASGGCWEYTADGWKENASLSWRSPGFEQTDRDPVVCVSWDDAKAYVAWLSETTTGRRYRLPSEAEWEYAARAKTATMRPWGDDRDNRAGCAYANGADLTAKDKLGWSPTMDCRDGQVYTAPVGSYSANDFGLHDVIGNAWEWVEDCWNDSYEASERPDDGSAWTAGDCSRRVLRGGSWSVGPGFLRSADRFRLSSGGRLSDSGFRVARTLSRSESVTP